MLSTLSPIKRGTACLSPLEMFDAGYRDGLNRRTDYRFYNKNSEYTSGHIAGYRDRPTSLFNLEILTQAPLEQGWDDELLNAL